ncbi:hypothetical protein ACLB1T_29420 [Escherichia coli]
MRFKILSRVFNFDHVEVAANPVHLFYVLEQQIEREQFPQEQAERYLEFLKGYLIPKYAEFIGKEIQTAYLEYLFRIWAKHFRPLCYLRGFLDSGSGVSRSGYRAAV